MKLATNFINYLSFYVLFELIIETLVTFPPVVSSILLKIDFLVCMIFLYDWFYYFITCTDRKNYILNRFFDLISSIPFLYSVRWLRVFRLFRVLRGLRGVLVLMKSIKKKPMSSTLLLYAIFLIIIYGYCTFVMYRYEYNVNNSIHSFYDVMWLCFTTLSTVGYGDLYPVTVEGRIVAAILVIVGAGFFALMSGEFAVVLLKLTKNIEEESH